NFGFPESHALSFAHLVFASAWFKFYHPAAFCAALLRAQPMGFYSPQSLVADARRHGVVVRGPDINASAVYPTLESYSDSVRGWDSARCGPPGPRWRSGWPPNACRTGRTARAVPTPARRTWPAGCG